MTFICAEIGVNWRNLNEADEMIREAAAAGANACKFQAYEKFCSPDQDETLKRALNDIRLDETAVRYLYWRCRAAGVEFMCTPMYPESVAMLDPYVKRWKVRYKDRENLEILDAIEKTGKPALISGGNVFCIPEYPPGKQSIPPCDLDEKGYVGYSSHIPCWKDPTVLGDIKYLEVHVKRDHYPDNYCPIDNAVSITMSELAELCRRLKK